MIKMNREARQNFGMFLMFVGAMGLAWIQASVHWADFNKWLGAFLAVVAMVLIVEGKWQIRKASNTLNGHEMAMWHKYEPPPEEKESVGFLAQGRKPEGEQDETKM